MVEPEGKRAPVMEQIQTNTEQLNVLRENVEKLEMRLNAVLVNEPPQTDSIAKTPDESVSPIKRSLDDQRNIINRINEQVRCIMQRLEI